MQVTCTGDGAEPASFYGPQGLGDPGRAPGPRTLWRPLLDPADAGRAWALFERLAGVTFPSA